MLVHNSRPLSLVTTAKVIYDPARPGMKRRTQGWVVLNVDREITRYYRYWVQQRYGVRLCEPSWNAHVSIVRGERIHPDIRQKFWARLNNTHVTLHYAHHPIQIRSKRHFWCIEAYSPTIDEIRTELGLPIFNDYHITIGRTYTENDFIHPRY